MLVIAELELQGNAVYAARSVDLVNSQLCAVLYSDAVLSRSTGDRTDTADNKCSARTLGPAVACVTGLLAVGVTARKAERHSRCQRYGSNTLEQILHNKFPFFSIHNK